MLSQAALETVLGIKDKTALSPEQMVDKLKITFFPPSGAPISADVQAFAAALQDLFDELHVNTVPYEEALIYTPLFKSKRIRSGISVVMLGEYEDGALPIDHVSSFRESSVIAIVDKPRTITRSTDFGAHFDASVALIARHMAHIVILVEGSEWILYNFNASHPFYDRRKDFKADVVQGLIPKIVAPVRPFRFSDMTCVGEGFDYRDSLHRPYVDDLVRNARLLDGTGLYPPGKRIDDVPFRSDLYRLIGAMHLDNRNGMSYGFLARQLPTKLSEPVPIEEAKRKFGESCDRNDYLHAGEELFIIIDLADGRYCMKVPEVWVLSQRSGSNKTDIVPEKDLVKLGLKNGSILIQAPRGLRLGDDYKPSFDTGVILAHAVGNAIIASILRHVQKDSAYAEQIQNRGAAIAHWHGYIDPARVPEGWAVHGLRNPHVSCSSPQASLYAIRGKFEQFVTALRERRPFRGEVHIEPHHGTNMTHSSLEAIAKLFLDNPGLASLGNKYLDAHFETAHT